MQKTTKGSFIELLFTGKVNGQVFDSNIKEDISVQNSRSEPKPLKIIIGEGMVVSGLDSALEDKEVGKDYSASFSYEQGFGPRRRELIKTIPLSVYVQHKINPVAGMPVLLDNNLAKVIAISGARVITDFNNPLAGKDLDYEFKINRIIEEEKEKIEVFLTAFFRHLPEFELKDNEVIISGKSWLENYVSVFGERFNEYFSKKLVFNLREDKTEEKISQ